MSGVARRRYPVSALLLAPAAFAVHQARYWLAFGSGTGAELERTGHSYLHSVAPWLVLVVALVAGSFLRSLGRALGGQTTLRRYTFSFAGLWVACWLCLVAIFTFQELVEGMLIAGHPAGLVGVFGYGGWWALPAAGCVSLVLAAWYHGARWLIDEVARLYGCLPAVRRAMAPRPLASRMVPALAPDPLIAGWSDRGPPRP